VRLDSRRRHRIGRFRRRHCAASAHDLQIKLDLGQPRLQCAEPIGPIHANTLADQATKESPRHESNASAQQRAQRTTHQCSDDPHGCPLF